MAERRLPEPDAALERVRDTERGEGRLQRGPPGLERRAHNRDLLGRGAGTQELENLVRDELERGSPAGTLEKADGALEKRRLGRPTLAEEAALELTQGGLTAGRGWQLL
jgi:hypothetical protein